MSLKRVLDLNPAIFALFLFIPYTSSNTTAIFRMGSFLCRLNNRARDMGIQIDRQMQLTVERPPVSSVNVLSMDMINYLGK